LQGNLSRPPGREHFEPTSMFIWNWYLTQEAFQSPTSIWRLNVIHGFVDQSRISVFGHNIFVTLIARRSRHFAGARFLKRGANNKGYVANDVETEQIVHDAATTSFFLPPGRYGSNPGYTSFLQHRGSIPVYWAQEAAAMAAKPQIELTVVDPYYTAAAKHFNSMFKRYGTPIMVLNLVKCKEKTRRESILLEQLTDAITYLNQFLPDDRRIQYVAWDMAHASKSGDQDVIATLEDLAEQVLETTGFFHSGAEPSVNVERRAITGKHRTTRMFQHGILRTNCVDCLDRTNAAEFVVGKCALGHQLFALGILTSPYVPFDCDAVNVLNILYHDHGDTIALQYGGSHLVNTMETYRKISPWTSHSRDMIESIRRYYSNSFTDAEKQDAMNLFLGNYVPLKQTTPLWELTSDFALHNEHPLLQAPIPRYGMSVSCTFHGDDDRHDDSRTATVRGGHRMRLTSIKTAACQSPLRIWTHTLTSTIGQPRTR
ncbi:SacI homology domain-containing protein, partial [Entophlyctis helioformis]